MKVYLVAMDTYLDNYGSQIETFGVYTTKERAIERCNELRKCMFVPENVEDCIHELEVNKDENIYLGGYIE